MSSLNGSPDRACLDHWLQEHIEALEGLDARGMCVGLHSGITLRLPVGSWTGRAQVRGIVDRFLAQCSALRLIVRRRLIDLDQAVVAIEWILRTRGQSDNTCYELLGATALDFDSDGLLRSAQTYLDLPHSRAIADLHVPLPPEPWAPSLKPGPLPARAEVERLLARHAEAWTARDPARLRALLHPEIRLYPPWDFRAGPADVERAIVYHIEEYIDTVVTPERILYDDSQPHLGVCQQTFACTDRKTGRRGEDRDFALFEIAEGRLRYWRNYFDAANSVQDGYADVPHVNDPEGGL